MFVKQLAGIERREARLRRIRARLSRQGRDDPVGNTPQEHHHIGVSQKHFEHIGTFLYQHAGDPAVQVLSIQEMTFPIVNIALSAEFLAKVEAASHSPHFIEAAGPVP
jgi:hypothetical protein